MSRRSSRGLGPLVFVFGGLASFFPVLVGWCVAGWAGVAAVMAVVGLLIWAIASEIQGSAERQRRADEEFVRRYYEATYTSAPQRRTRRARGGVR